MHLNKLWSVGRLCLFPAHFGKNPPPLRFSWPSEGAPHHPLILWELCDGWPCRCINWVLDAGQPWTWWPASGAGHAMLWVVCWRSWSPPAEWVGRLQSRISCDAVQAQTGPWPTPHIGRLTHTSTPTSFNPICLTIHLSESMTTTLDHKPGTLRCTWQGCTRAGRLISVTMVTTALQKHVYFDSGQVVWTLRDSSLPNTWSLQREVWELVDTGAGDRGYCHTWLY